MMIVGFGEFIDTTDGQQSLFARIRLSSGHEFDFPLIPDQLEILKTQLQADAAPAAAPVAEGSQDPRPAPVQPKLAAKAPVPPPLLRKTDGDTTWMNDDDDEEPEGFQLAVSVDL